MTDLKELMRSDFGKLRASRKRLRDIRHPVLRKLKHIKLADIWPKPEKVEKVPATLRRYRVERRRKNREASHSRARNRG